MEEEGEEINPSKGKIQKEDAWMDNDRQQTSSDAFAVRLKETGSRPAVMLLQWYLLHPSRCYLPSA
jgi:hypothetical protein